MTARVLVVADEPALNRSLARRLTMEGFFVESVRTGPEVRASFERDWDVILLHLRTSQPDDLELLRTARQSRPGQLVVALTPDPTFETAITAIKLGAHDALKMPLTPKEVVTRVRRALKTTSSGRAGRGSRGGSRRETGLPSLIGDGAAMREMHEVIRRVAKSDAATVLITGESGTGKDMVAKAIHFESRRARKPLMTVTCTAIAEQLLESELFGHEEGSFTGASARKRGLFEIANGGTIFLDEIGDLSPALQAKLLRVLQEKTFRRVGGTRDISVDVRIVAATHQSLPAAMAQGRFRHDLYYRLNVVDIVVPPLRARSEDIPLLTWNFVRGFNKELGTSAAHVAAEALARLMRYPWPGNVRELKNAVERALILGQDSTLRPAHLPTEIRQIEVTELQTTEAETIQRGLERASEIEDADPGPASTGAGGSAGTVGGRGDELEPAEASIASPIFLPPGGVDLNLLRRELVRQAMERAKGNKTRAGRLLGLNRDQVRYSLAKYSLTDPEGPSRVPLG